MKTLVSKKWYTFLHITIIIYFFFSVTPQLSGKRRPWDEESTKVIMAKFGERCRNNTTIKGVEINDLIKSTPCLKGRKENQVRAFLHYKKKTLGNESLDDNNETNNSMKRKCSDSPNVITKRNRLDRRIYINFMTFIDNKVMPSKAEILQAYSKSPSLEKYSPKVLEDLIQKAIHFDTIDFNNSM